MADPTRLVYEKCTTDNNTFVFPQSDTIYAVVLAADTEDEITIPAGATIAFIAATATFWMKIDGTSAIPVANVEDGSASELNPTSCVLRGNSTMSFISNQACTVTISFYS